MMTRFKDFRVSTQSYNLSISFKVLLSNLLFPMMSDLYLRILFLAPKNTPPFFFFKLPKGKICFLLACFARYKMKAEEIYFAEHYSTQNNLAMYDVYRCLSVS